MLPWRPSVEVGGRAAPPFQNRSPRSSSPKALCEREAIRVLLSPLSVSFFPSLGEIPSPLAIACMRRSLSRGRVVKIHQHEECVRGFFPFSVFLPFAWTFCSPFLRSQPPPSTLPSLRRARANEEPKANDPHTTPSKGDT